MQESRSFVDSANNVFGWTVFKQLSSAQICFCTRQFHGPKFVFDCAALYCLATGCKCNSASLGSSRPVIYKWIQHDPATQCCKQSKGEVNGIKRTPQQRQQEVSPGAKPPGHAGKAFPLFLLPILRLAKAWDHDRGDEVRPRALVLAQYMPVALFGLRSFVVDTSVLPVLHVSKPCVSSTSLQAARDERSKPRKYIEARACATSIQESTK